MSVPREWEKFWIANIYTHSVGHQVNSDSTGLDLRAQWDPKSTGTAFSPLLPGRTFPLFPADQAQLTTAVRCFPLL